MLVDDEAQSLTADEIKKVYKTIENDKAELEFDARQYYSDRFYQNYSDDNVMWDWLKAISGKEYIINLGVPNGFMNLAHLVLLARENIDEIEIINVARFYKVVGSYLEDYKFIRNLISNGDAICIENFNSDNLVGFNYSTVQLKIVGKVIQDKYLPSNYQQMYLIKYLEPLLLVYGKKMCKRKLFCQGAATILQGYKIKCTIICNYCYGAILDTEYVSNTDLVLVNKLAGLLVEQIVQCKEKITTELQYDYLRY